MKENFTVGKEVELEQSRAMFYIPDDSVEIKMEVTLYTDGEIHKVCRVIDLQGIRKAIEDAENNYFEDDDMFVLTEEGKRYLRENGD